MATQLQFRRGTTTEHSTFTGVLAEVTVDTTKKTLVVHDGSTAGGFPVATLQVAQTFTQKQQFNAGIEVGDPGLETSGININGTTYTAAARINDIGGANAAQLVIHRHSTLLQPLIIGARTNSNTSSHIAVTVGQSLFSIFGAGWTGSHYDSFAAIDMLVSTTGTISATSSPGKIVFSTSPDGSNSPAAVLTLDADKSATFTGIITNASGSFIIYPGANSALLELKTKNSGGSVVTVAQFGGSTPVAKLKYNGNTVLETLAAGCQFNNDAAFTLSIVSSNPRLTLASTDYLEYARGTDELKAVIAATERLRVDASATADDTALLLYDVSATAMKRVSRGAADSGGAGYRQLLIPN